MVYTVDVGKQKADQIVEWLVWYVFEGVFSVPIRKTVNFCQFLVRQTLI